MEVKLWMSYPILYFEKISVFQAGLAGILQHGIMERLTPYVGFEGGQ